MGEWPQLPGHGLGPGPGPGGGDGSGPGEGDGVGKLHPAKKSYSGIASINKSIRENKNILEVRLERAEGARFNLTTVETEGLVVKLGIDSTHFQKAKVWCILLFILHSTSIGFSGRMRLTS